MSTNYYIKTLRTSIDIILNSGIDSISNPPLIRFNGTNNLSFIPDMITTSQNCYGLTETTRFYQPYRYSGVYYNLYSASLVLNRSKSGQYVILGSSSSGSWLWSNDYGATFNYFGIGTGFNLVTISDNGLQIAVFATSSTTIYISSDSGYSYTPVATSIPNGFFSVCGSSDGTKLVAADRLQKLLFRSTDSGANWTQIYDITSTGQVIHSVACSSDGTKISFAASNEKIYVSTNSGTSFTGRDSNRKWWGLSMSTDGATQYAVNQDTVANGGGVYKSINTGTTWNYYQALEKYIDIDSSPDGSTYVVTPGVYNSTIGYLSKACCPTNTTQFKMIYTDESYSNVGAYVSYDSGSNFNLLPPRIPNSYSITSLGGLYNIALNINYLWLDPSYPYDSSYWTALFGWDTSTETNLQNQMCTYFNNNKSTLPNFQYYDTINLYFIVVTVNGTNTCYIPLFYIGNDVNADRIYTI